MAVTDSPDAGVLSRNHCQPVRSVHVRAAGTDRAAANRKLGSGEKKGTQLPSLTSVIAGNLVVPVLDCPNIG